MTVYIFDEWKQVRKIIPQSGVTELIHDEDNNQLHAVVDMKLRIRNGEHLGFMCADKRFRLFTVVLSEEFDDQGVTIVTGIDASVQELRETIVENCNQTATIKTTVMGLLRSAGASGVWNVIGEDSVETKETKAYFTSVWNVLTQCEGLYLWQIIPYYTFHEGQISGRVIELAKDEAVYRGRILKSKKDATNVYVVRTDPPITRLYVTGASAGTGDMQTSITISGIGWYKAAGDPADKPAGQSWIDDTEAIRKHGLHAASIALTHIQTPEELIKAAWAELQKRKEPTCTVEANVQDMEQVHGYQHQIIRLGDRVPIHLSNATMEAARVINIKRDYIRPWLTKVVLGERVQTIQSQMRQMQDLSIGLDIGQDHAKKETEKNSSSIRDLGSQLLMNAALIQLNAEMIQANAHVIELNAEQIRMNAEQIDMKAGKQEVTELGETVTAAMVMIDGINAEVVQKASKAEITEVESRLSTAETRIDGAEAAIDLKAERTTVDALGTRISAAEIKIDGANEKVDLWAGQMDELSNRLNGAEVLIDGLNSAINLKASKSTVDALGERITSAEIKVDGANSKVDVLAEEIRLAGYVTADELESAIASLGDIYADSIMTGWINAGTGEFGSLTVSGSAAIPHLSAGSIEVGGTSFTSSSLTMGSVASGTIVGPSDINLSHSHAVSVSGGTVTLGEVSSSGGSFNIADTQYYKDGVAAAKEEGAQLVIVSNMYGSGGVITAKLTNGKEATLQLSQGSVSGTNIPIIGRGNTVMTVDANEVYKSGYTAGNREGFNDGYDSGYIAGQASIDTGAYYDEGYEIGYSTGYTSGKNSVTLSASGWSGNTNTITASNGESMTVTKYYKSATTVSSGDTVFVSYNGAMVNATYRSGGSTLSYISSVTVA